MSAPRSRTRPDARRNIRRGFRVEMLERRVLLSSAIAAFGAQQTFGTGSHPMTVTTADVNLDGKLDLLIANFGSNSVGVLLGTGDGTFQPQQTFATGASPYCVAVGDVNGDGKPDLVTANYDAGNVSVLLGNGNGTFQPQQAFAAGAGANSVAISDLNRDGKLDLAVANFGSFGTPGNTVSVLLGTGNGSFQPQQTFATSPGPTAVAAADVNRDGKPDLIVVDDVAGRVGILTGNGNGSFAPEQTFGILTDPTHVAVADLNTDGKLDLVVSSFTTSFVTVLPGNGDGTFGPQRKLAAGTYANSVAVSDVNGDGKPDLIVGNHGAGTVSVLLGNGNLTFQAQKTSAVGAEPTSVAAADVNGDGRVDLVATNYADDSVSVLLGDVPPVVLSIDRTTAGPITSAPTLTWTVRFNEPIAGLELGDFTISLDGHTPVTPDSLVQTAPTTYIVGITGLTSNGGKAALTLTDDGSIKNPAGNPLQPGGLPEFTAQRTFAVGSRPSSALAADVNGDGRPDIVVANRDDHNVGVLLGNGDGTFGNQVTFFAQVRPIFMTASDLNGDGRIDLVLNNGYPSASISVLLGNGDGTFQYPIVPAGGKGATSVAVSDTNGDGKLDLLVANLGGNYMSLLRGNGDGTFQSQSTFSVGPHSRCIAAADLNGDGQTDVVVGNDYGTGSILLGNGDGTFLNPSTFDAGLSPSSISIADLNGDGRPDLAVANYNNYPGTVSVLLGTGDGTFQDRATFAPGRGPTRLMAADVNGDGKLDLVVATYSAFTSSVLLGNGNGTFREAVTFSTGVFSNSVAASDVNGDGRLDLVVARSHYSSVGVLLGNSTGSFDAPTYTLATSLDTITGSPGADQFILIHDPDQINVDWTFGAVIGQLPIDHVGGLTINGTGAIDSIYFDYIQGNPLPNLLHLNGTFTLNWLQGFNPLANATLEIGRSTVYISYIGPSVDPVVGIKSSLANGYNAGAWTGTPTASTGVITSLAARDNPNHNTGIAWADYGDGTNVNTTRNTILLKYAVLGDTDLDGTVGLSDYTAVVRNFGTGTNWTQGAVTYGATVGLNDYTAVVRNFGQSVPFASPAVTSVASAGVATQQDVVASSTNTATALTTVDSVATKSHYDRHPHPAKVARKRR